MFNLYSICKASCCGTLVLDLPSITAYERRCHYKDEPNNLTGYCDNSASTGIQQLAVEDKVSSYGLALTRSHSIASIRSARHYLPKDAVDDDRGKLPLLENLIRASLKAITVINGLHVKDEVSLCQAYINCREHWAHNARPRSCVNVLTKILCGQRTVPHLPRDSTAYNATLANILACPAITCSKHSAILNRLRARLVLMSDSASYHNRQGSEEVMLEDVDASMTLLADNLACIPHLTHIETGLAAETLIRARCLLGEAFSVICDCVVDLLPPEVASVERLDFLTTVVIATN